MIRVGILGFSRRDGTFGEVGLRSWEEAGCAAVEAALMRGNELVYVVHRPLVIRITRKDIERTLRDWCDAPHVVSRCHVILTVGGTGYSAADIVPEATSRLIKQDAHAVAEMLRRAVADAGYPLDGVVLTSGCDKTTPACLMGAATVNIPAIVLSGGPMLDDPRRHVSDQHSRIPARAGRAGAADSSHKSAAACAAGPCRFSSAAPFLKLPPSLEAAC